MDAACDTDTGKGRAQHDFLIVGQQAINEYVRSPEEIAMLKRDIFPRSAKAFNCLLKLRQNDTVVESKKLFCDGRVLIDTGKTKDAILVLQRAAALDPKAAYAFNALGVAYRQEKESAKAVVAFTQAAQLAPSSWISMRSTRWTSYSPSAC